MIIMLFVVVFVLQIIVKKNHTRPIGNKVNNKMIIILHDVIRYLHRVCYAYLVRKGS